MRHNTLLPNNAASGPVCVVSAQAGDSATPAGTTLTSAAIARWRTCIRSAAVLLTLTFAMAVLAFPNTSWVTVAAGGSAQPITLPWSAHQDFALHLEATFSQNGDQGIALIPGPSSQSFALFAVTIRAIGSVIQALGPNGYPSGGFAFTPGIPIEMIITGNVHQKTFSAWMGVPGQSFVQIANNVGFRAGAQPASLDTLMVWADTGTISVNLVSSSCSAAGVYNQTVLADHPVAFWNMNPLSTTEPDVTGNGNAGVYMGGAPSVATMPNGDLAAVFNGSSEYLTVPSRPSLSIPNTDALTWEMWIDPSALQFPKSSAEGYVDLMGKCANYSPTCEWEARLYSTTNSLGRCNRFSAYAFNPNANLGSGADWQPVCGLVQAGQWVHVVGEYTTLSQPSDCPAVPASPGSLDIWVNGVKWNQSAHSPTGCMSQYNIVPRANNSPLNIGTMALDTWFKGAIGKVAIYNYELSQTQITNHYKAMTGRLPTGSCGTNTCTF